MPPSATLPQNAPETAVGRSVKARNVVGSTPSVATYFPLTLIRAASIRPAATTPGTDRSPVPVPPRRGMPISARTCAAAALFLHPAGAPAAAGDEFCQRNACLYALARARPESWPLALGSGTVLETA